MPVCIYCMYVMYVGTLSLYTVHLSVCLPAFLHFSTVCMSACLSIFCKDFPVCISVCQCVSFSFVCLYVCMSVCLYVCMSVCLYVCLPACLNSCRTVCTSISVCMFYIWLSLHLSVFLPPVLPYCLPASRPAVLPSGRHTNEATSLNYTRKRHNWRGGGGSKYFLQISRFLVNISVLCKKKNSKFLNLTKCVPRTLQRDGSGALENWPA
jgi:hypothetical protein